LERIATALIARGDPLQLAQSRQRSFLVSSDMAHAWHPNYSDKHEAKHRPLTHKGVAIKMNVEQRYATTAATALVVEECARLRGVPLQRFVVRNDSPCGSTIGPILAGETGIKSVDVGAPMLAMHSIREMMGVDDASHLVDFLEAFYTHFSAVDARLKVD